MRVSMLLLMLIAWAVPGGASAQAQSSERAGITAQTPQARMDAALATAARTGIPASLLESKIAEGRAKSVPPERIAGAVEARLDALIRASNVLKAGGVRVSEAGELSVAADAIQAGVDHSLLLRVMRSSPDDQRAVATAVLTQLIQLGYDAEPAFLRLNNALSAGPDALANLQAELSAMLRVRGLSPSALDFAGGLSATGNLIR